MANPSPQQHSVQAGAPCAADIPVLHDERPADMALGFECAAPWLQIESWAQDAGARPALFT